MTTPVGDHFVRRFQNMMQSVQENYPGTPNISVEVRNDEEFDIYATTMPGGAYAIVATTGALYQIASYFFMVAATVEVLMAEAVPNPARTPEEMAHLSDQRVALDMLLITNAFDFILLHELGHILRGHLRMVQQGRISEIDLAGDDRPEVNYSKALELDADLFAAKFIASRELVGELPIQLRDWETTANRNITGAALAAFSAASLFRLFHHLSNGETDEEHPPSMFRLYMVALTVIAEQHPDLPTKAVLAGEVALWAERVFAYVWGVGADAVADERELEAAVALLAPLFERLRELWPTLEPNAVVQYEVNLL